MLFRSDTQEKEAGPEKTKGEHRQENWGRGGVPKRTGNISNHTLTEIAANTDSGTERTLMSDTQRCESTDYAHMAPWEA